MKTIIRNIVLALVLVLGAQTLNAQETLEETITLPLTKPGQAGILKISLIRGSITVEGYSGQDVIITAQSRSRNSRRSSGNKYGLKKLISSNSLEYTAKEKNNVVSISTGNPNSLIDYTIKVPINFSLNLKTINNGKIRVDNVNGEFEITNLNGPITMNNIEGSVIADAINEDIVITFAAVSGKPMAFSGINGNFDITFPKNIKASIKALTRNGEIYTDFDIALKAVQNELQKERKNGVYKVKREGWIHGDINGGGLEISFKTMNGDIIIRSKS